MRIAIARMLNVSADHVRVTGGVRAAAAAFAEWAAGRHADIESPTFADVRQLFRRGDAEGAGVNPFVWVTTPCRNPDGRTLDAQECDRLSRMTAAGATVIVNEIYRWFRPAFPRVVRGVRVGSLAKIAGGGMRVGWIVNPPDDEVLVRLLAAAAPPTHWQHAVADFVTRGGLDILAASAVFRPRAAAQIFRHEAPPGAVADACDPASPHLLLRVACEKCAVSAMESYGVRCGAGSAFVAQEPSVRLSFASVGPDEARTVAKTIDNVVRAVASRCVCSI